MAHRHNKNIDDHSYFKTTDEIKMASEYEENSTITIKEFYEYNEELDGILQSFERVEHLTQPEDEETSATNNIDPLQLPDEANVDSHELNSDSHAINFEVINCGLCDNNFTRQLSTSNISNVCPDCKSEFEYVSSLVKIHDKYARAILLPKQDKTGTSKMKKIKNKLNNQVKQKVVMKRQLPDKKLNAIKEDLNEIGLKFDSIEDVEIKTEMQTKFEFEPTELRPMFQEPSEIVYCKKCKDPFESISHLVLHTETCTTYKCPICSNSYDNKMNFQSHMFAHQSCTCEICGKEFDNKINRVTHEKNEHNSGDYLCNMCGISFVIEDLLNWHLKNHENENSNVSRLNLIEDTNKQENTNGLICTICNEEFLSSIQLEIHQFYNHEPSVITPFKYCSTCKRYFTHEYFLKVHILGHKNTCFFCNKTFINAKLLQIHQSSFHTVEIFGKDGFKCSHCDVVFSSRIILKNHSFIHNRPDFPDGIKVYKCLKCTDFEEYFSFNDCLIVHQQEIHGSDSCDVIEKGCVKFMCNLCGFVIDSINSFKIHGKTHISYKKTGFYRCPVCEMMFHNKSVFSKHLKDVHVNKYVCEHCEVRLGSKEEFRKHKKNFHDEDEPSEILGGDVKKEINLEVNIKKEPPLIFICELCNINFNTKETLKRHFARKHEALSDIFCPICLKRFVEPIHLEKHVEKHALNKKCNKCNNYILKCDYAQHLEDHKNEGLQYFCDLCNNTFISKNIFMCHEPCQSKKSGNDELREECQLCEEIFPTFILPKHLEKHNITQTEEVKKSDYWCQMCSRNLHDTRSYSQHIKNHEKNLLKLCSTCETYYSKNDISDHVKMHKEVILFKCDVCGEKFFDLKSCVIHSFMHPKENRKYFCPICDFNWFARKINCAEHLTTDHCWSNTFFEESVHEKYFETVGGKMYVAKSEAGSNKKMRQKLLKPFDLPPTTSQIFILIDAEGNQVGQERNNILEYFQSEEVPTTILSNELGSVTQNSDDQTLYINENQTTDFDESNVDEMLNNLNKASSQFKLFSEQEEASTSKNVNIQHCYVYHTDKTGKIVHDKRGQPTVKKFKIG